jgi:homoserine O-acetyltransferase
MGQPMARDHDPGPGSRRDPLANALGVRAWAAVVGGSMGGMRALEWALCQPHRVHRALILAVGAEASADQIATCRVQIDAIRADPNWHSGDYYDAPTGPATGMAIARRIAHLTYRCAAEVDTRFGRTVTAGGDPLNEGLAIESWLDHGRRSSEWTPTGSTHCTNRPSSSTCSASTCR